MIRAPSILSRNLLSRRPLRNLSSSPHSHVAPPRPRPRRAHPPTQPPSSSPPPPSPSLSQHTAFHLRQTLLLSLNLLLAGHLFAHYCYAVRFPVGPSMLPTLNLRHDVVLVSRFHRAGAGVAVGDIVSYEHPVRQGFRGVKRVVALPGDVVGRDTPGEGEGWMVRVPEGHCWVVGDNLPWSRDSRHFGPLPLALIRGKVVARLWPWTWFGDPLRAVEQGG